MFKAFLICAFFGLAALNISAQVVPSEGRELNYRLIGFSFPPGKLTTYTLEIASGHISSEALFKDNIVKALHSGKNKIIAEVPAFGVDYTWRVVYKNEKSKEVVTSQLYHFRTGNNEAVDVNVNRLRVTKPARKHSDAYVFINNKPVMYDMAGNPVWYLPKANGQNRTVSDIKLTPQGTITFISGDEAVEVNYDGQELWKARKDELAGIEGFHHELTRLNNGHYMVLSNETLPCAIQADSSIRIVAANEKANQTNGLSSISIPFGKIVEYDGQGKVVWQWRSSKYYGESDLVNRSLAGVGTCNDVHPNAFYFNEKDKTIYLSCKNISRIVKIKYPSGEVLGNYGESFAPNTPNTGNDLFCRQHGIKMAHDGGLLLFNNNSCNPGLPPAIEKFQEPSNKSGKLKMVWQYPCVDSAGDPKLAAGLTHRTFPVGGNVMELNDGTLFVSTASPDNRLLVINMKKEILWCAQPERFDPELNKWQTVLQYRGSIIETKKMLENLIWNSNDGGELLSAK